MKKYKYFVVILGLLLVGIPSYIKGQSATASVPMLTLVNNSGVGNPVVLVTVNADPNSEVGLYYVNQAGFRTFAGTLGWTDRSGGLIQIVDGRSFGIKISMPVYVVVGNQQSQVIPWPESTSNTLGYDITYVPAPRIYPTYASVPAGLVAAPYGYIDTSVNYFYPRNRGTQPVEPVRYAIATHNPQPNLQLASAQYTPTVTVPSNTTLYVQQQAVSQTYSYNPVTPFVSSVPSTQQTVVFASMDYKPVSIGGTCQSGTMYYCASY